MFIRFRASFLIFAAFLLFSTLDAQAQRRYNYFSLGLTVGVSHYQGDLDDNGFDWWNVFSSKENENIGNPFALLRPGFGACLNYHFHPHMYVRFAFNQGWIGASDEKNTDGPRIYRNLHFKSHVTEISAQLVYEFFATQRHYRYRPTWSPYIYSGIAVFNFSPKAKPDEQWLSAYPGLFSSADEWVALQPLGTEGQYLDDPDNRYPDPYKLTQISIPVGIGVRRKINDRMDVFIDMGIRKTFTDHLDDVSGRITPVEMMFPGGDYRAGGAYASMNEFFDQGQVKSALFSDRSGYIYSSRPFDPLEDRSRFDGPADYSPDAYGIRPGGWKATGEIRGNRNDLDWYMFTTVGVTYILDKPDRCPKFK
ncbi:MAG: outer membrane beta-barrel protein [Bacteroidetes bacterium]|nr:outer membrane beta-barrel protein [Bacteroidota bacterium]